MLDIKSVRENPLSIKENLEKRKDPAKIKLLDELLKVDIEWRKLQTETNKLRQKRNQLSVEIAKQKKLGKPAKKELAEAKKVDASIGKSEKKLSQLEANEKSLLMNIPNMLHWSVPIGKDDSDNVEVRKWGEQPKFDFEPKDHLTILQNLDLIDVERGAKIAGERFYYMKGDLVLLDMALQKFALDVLRKKGFTIISPPLMIRRKPYEGVTDLTDFEMVTYKIENEDAYLIATSEHPIAAMFLDEVLDVKKLPLMFAGVSPCFRKEVGTHGKYTKGLFRMHHFNKVEQFVFSLPEQSWKLHEEIQRNCELLYQSLGLHYRIVNVCTGDIGSIAAKKYDTEVWMSDGQFREVGSNSNCTDYQARRLGIRFREGEGKPVKGFVHTLNNTALATSRVMIAIIEQFQQKDGSVVIPRVLRPYMFGIEKLEKKR
ncbi:MAG: serine--tRNA ligase [Candidatus Aenigmarchaeota archaeon]|nr:serine--tRNA ligase [Candidatus Aenigmarchaeota archaeon]